MKAIPSFLFTALLATTYSAFAQQATPAPQTAQAKEPEPDLATLRAMKSKLFVIQHRDPASLCQALYPLQSGARAAKVSWADRDGLNVISVRDFPENLATIEDAIKRLDVPSATSKATDVELHIHVLFASKTAAAETDVPEEMQAVLKALKGTLTYRSYTMAASFVQRVHTPNQRRIEGKGVVDLKSSDSDGGKVQPNLVFEWSANTVGLETPKDGAPTIHLREFQIRVQENKNNSSTGVARFDTDLSFKEGEKVVVGTSVIKDRGLIVVLSARRVN